MLFFKLIKLLILELIMEVNDSCHGKKLYLGSKLSSPIGQKFTYALSINKEVFLCEAEFILDASIFLSLCRMRISVFWGHELLTDRLISKRYLKSDIATWVEKVQL